MPSFPSGSVAWLPLVCDDSPLVDEVPDCGTGPLGRHPVADAVRILHRHAALRDVTTLVDVSGAGGLGPPPAPVVPRLQVDLGGAPTPLETVYAASMVFVVVGPYSELLSASAEAARRDCRLFSSGGLVGFNLPVRTPSYEHLASSKWKPLPPPNDAK